MFSAIAGLSGSDDEFLKLWEQARECAHVYLLAKRRQRGCDGMGDLAMVKEEFGDSLNGLTSYCKRKGYLSGDIQYEIDSAAEVLCDLDIAKRS